MAKRIGRVLLAGLLSALVLVACATPNRGQDQFHGANLDYLQRLRWHDFYGAARHLPAEEREAFLERFLSLDDLHITDVRLERIELNPDGRGATTRVVLEYYLLPSARVKTLILRQEWVLTPAGWRMITPIPPLNGSS